MCGVGVSGLHLYVNCFSQACVALSSDELDQPALVNVYLHFCVCVNCRGFVTLCCGRLPAQSLDQLLRLQIASAAGRLSNVDASVLLTHPLVGRSATQPFLLDQMVII